MTSRHATTDKERQEKEMAAVLSLNGKPQVTLRVRDQQFVEEQHQLNGASSAVAVGAATQQIMQVLGALTRIKISDGRIVVGRLHCFDKHQNVILTDAREFPPLAGQPEKPPKKKEASGGNSENAAAQQQYEDVEFEKHRSETTSRSLGMTLVPGKHIVYIKVQKAS